MAEENKKEFTVEEYQYAIQQILKKIGFYFISNDRDLPSVNNSLAKIQEQIKKNIDLLWSYDHKKIYLHLEDILKILQSAEIVYEETNNEGDVIWQSKSLTDSEFDNIIEQTGSVLTILAEFSKTTKKSSDLDNKTFSKEEYIYAIDSIVKDLKNVMFFDDLELGSYKGRLEIILKKIKSLSFDYLDERFVLELYDNLNSLRTAFGSVYSFGEDHEKDERLNIQIENLDFFITDIMSETNSKIIREKEEAIEEKKQAKKEVKEIIEEKTEEDFFGPIKKEGDRYTTRGWWLIIAGLVIILLGSFCGDILGLCARISFEDVYKHRLFIKSLVFGIFFVFQGTTRLSMGHQLNDFVLRGRNIVNREKVLSKDKSDETTIKHIYSLIENRIFEIKKEKLSHRQIIKILKELNELKKTTGE